MINEGHLAGSYETESSFNLTHYGPGLLGFELLWHRTLHEWQQSLGLSIIQPPSQPSQQPIQGQGQGINQPPDGLRHGRI